MRDQIAEYLKDVTISNRKELFDVLNFIAPLIDGWSLAEPKSGRQIMRFASANARKSAYVDFTIPKKSGGQRKISAPVKPLKAIQTALNIVLQSIFVPDEHATGFVLEKSVKDNAMIHVGQTCIFNTDLENFFPSITKLMVRRALHRELGDRLQSNEVINIICRICTVPDSSGVEVLPQGAPTSPVLSNIVLKSLDKDMSKRRMSPFWQSRIYNIIAKYGLKVNEKKTRTFVPGTRRGVTGVVVSDKINVPRSYIKQLRVLLHLWEKYGYAQAQIIFTRDFYKGIEKSLVNVIDGKINYLEMIKGKEDSTYRKFKSRFKRLQWEEKQSTNQIQKAI